MAPQWPRVVLAWMVANGLGACSGRSPSAPTPERRPAAADVAAPSTETARTRSPADAAALTSAHALRLGRGVPRDFVAAARAYAELCHAGCGDAEACREYLHLAAFARGAVLARADLDIAVRLCDRGDGTACQFASLVGMRPKDYDPAAVDTACAADDRKACAMAAALDFEGTRLGIPCEGMCEPSPPSLGHRATLNACLHGDGRACSSVMSSHVAVCGAAGLPTIEACIDNVAREFESAKLGSAKPLRDAWSMTRALCADGDPDACSVVPGQAIAHADLCSAGDWMKCSWATDPAQRRRACTAGYVELCEPPGERSSGATRLLTLRQRCQQGDRAVCADVARETAVAACPKAE